MRSVLLLALLCRAAGAQEFRATLTGRVVDPGEAHIGGASVMVTNTGANTATSTKTDSQGNYTVPFLTPGENQRLRRAFPIAFMPAARPKTRQYLAAARGICLRADAEDGDPRGWGRYYINPNNDFQQTYGFSNSTSLSASTDSNRTGIPNKTADPFPRVLTPDGHRRGC